MFGISLEAVASAATTVSAALAAVLLLLAMALVAGRTFSSLRQSPAVQAGLAAVRVPALAVAVGLVAGAAVFAVPMCTTGKIESGGGICTPPIDPDHLVLTSVHPIFWVALAAFAATAVVARPYPQVLVPKQ